MLSLPTTALKVFTDVWAPTMMDLSYRLRCAEANVLGIAIGGQESGYTTRTQDNGGPAHGFWQMEEGATEHSGVRGVMNHPASQPMAQQWCHANGIAWDSHTIWLALVDDDETAAAFARFLLWTSANKLPAVGNSAGAWAYYLDVWRPGLPDESRWGSAYAAALAAVRES